jgi:WD40 repeat protein/uncharacterized caspase-like protein
MQVNARAPAIQAVRMSRDGKVVTASIDGMAKVWDLANARQTFALKNTGMLTDAAFLPDGKVVAASNTAGNVALWDASTGRLIRQFPGSITSVSDDGRYALGEVWHGTKVLLLDLSNGKILREFSSGLGGAISADGRHVAVTTIENVGNVLFAKYVTHLAVYETASGRRLWRQAVHGAAVAFTPDGKSLLFAVGDATTRMIELRLGFILFDVASGQQIKEFGQTTIPDVMRNGSKYIRSVAFAPDGKRFVIGQQDGSNSIWDLDSGRMVREVKPAEGLVSSIVRPSFSRDGRVVVTGTLASAKVVDAATGSDVATLISFEDGEWLITTPSGYYNASEKGDQYLGVTVAGKAYTIAQVRESFFRPDLVKAALAGRALDELRKVADLKPPPSVAIVETATSVSTDDVVITLKVTDQGGGIGDVRLYRNGTAVMLEKSRNLQVGESAQTLRYTVKLEGGANAIRAVAFNGDNSMQSADATLTVTASFAARRPTLYAVVVGIQDFKNPRLKLSYPIADATLFSETLKGQSSTLYQSVNVTLLTTPEQTTREGVMQVLRTFKDKVKPEDLFVFFVASHGTADEGEYFLITSNVGALSTERLKADALTQGNLKELLANIPATKKLIIIDTCNAGALGDALQAAFLTRGMTDATAMKILGRAVGSTVLSASTSTQEALEGYQGHGLFTYVIAEGLAGKADANKDGYVSTLELATYVDDRVPVLAEQIFKHAQYPVVSPSGQGFPLVRVR